ncbi:ATP-grasp domain-containing protein [Asticcacaulis sp. AC402]|uniref:ATP-grasp domain-containing protein n=1 Tax=Asticcacaulis sp. AC402 TaxID=1282361 RepID=UPI0004241ABF|nr:ATP-grasp domain-containing protein [Asticcacaulis sp. AC402]
MKILLTGTRAPVTRDLASAFTACGHEVHGIDSLAAASTSRALASFTLCAAPARCFDAFARQAEAIVDQLKPDLIVPLCEDIFYWAKASHGWPLFAPGLKPLMRLHSKMAFIDQAQALGLSVPKTRRVKPDEGATPGDWVYKPEFSRFGTHTVIRPKRDQALAHDPANPWLQQAWIAGEDLSFHAIAKDGRVRAFAAYRSDWRTDGGASYYFDPVEGVLANKLETIATTLAGALNLTGQFACDLRRDGDGGLWLIECNPRATSGLHLLVHDPQALCAAFTGTGDGVVHSNGLAACIGAAMWFYGLGQGRLRQWQGDRARARDVLDGVAWTAALDTAGFMTRAALCGQSLQAFLTADFECNRDLTCT